MLRTGVPVGRGADASVSAGVVTNVRAILLDIEGTTTPTTFVVGALFPYVRRHLRDYLREHSESTDLQSVIERFRVEWEIDRAKAAPAWVDTPPVARLASVAAYLSLIHI